MLDSKRKAERAERDWGRANQADSKQNKGIGDILKVVKFSFRSEVESIH